MALVDLIHVKNLFKSKADAQLETEVYRELLLMVLARATDADSYTHPAEVEVVQRVLEERLQQPIDASDIRIAARSKLYETAPLEKYIARLGPRLPKSDRRNILISLVDVLKADGRVAASEVRYFNMVALALELSFADIFELTEEQTQ
ncbi:MAG: TerB family tellurite resistance protein [Halioglobus sp.]